MARYSAVLDACVLVPVTLTDTLLRVAERGLFRPLWSETILAEAAAATLVVHPDVDPARIENRFSMMTSAFEDALVTGWEDLARSISLPDEDDWHVVAAAIVGHADAIVTANVRDYPAEALGPLEIEVMHPDDFLLNQLDLAPKVVVDVLNEQAEHSQRPPLAMIDVVARLGRAGAPEFAAEVGRLI